MRSRGRKRSAGGVTAAFGDGNGQEARDAGGPREPRGIGFSPGGSTSTTALPTPGFAARGEICLRLRPPRPRE